MSLRLAGGIAVLVVAAGLAAFGTHAILRVSHMKAEMAAQEREIAVLRARAEALGKTAERLRNDPAYLEKIAREEYGYVREGETVLKFPRHEPPKPPEQ
ncbi:MAG TPA: septum formation initiator family protein [Candidatus Limnocylindria bacterium]|nr:septum formation initiator family protein [Candidatus Limnocylindria bacterium]